jgi:membrane protease YdiL (CAAX protease family)
VEAGQWADDQTGHGDREERAAFGIWHIRPTVQALRVNGLADGRRQAIAGAFAGVAVTTAGGVLLSWLRERSGSLAAPVLLHLATNCGGLVAAWAVTGLNRRTRNRPPHRRLPS